MNDRMTDEELADLARRAIALIKAGDEPGAEALVRKIPEAQRAYFYVSLRGAVRDKKKGRA